MPRIDFDALPDGARLWIFASARSLDENESDRILSAVDEFLDGWAAHGTPLTTARDWRYSRFLFVAVDENAAGASGCSIDALVRGMRLLEGELNTRLVDYAPVDFRDGDEIRRVSRAEFANLARDGSVSPDTPVFNNAVTSVGQVRGGEWEVPAADSWHGPAFFG